ncbi:putative calcium-transporting ATPase [Tetrabaena socialis]|uniref:Putative calcium-transporting ATPase n=1 Tax=Tetrabaena socialis TaxID=47790 RepID=A0A2J8A7Q9_9CHLO|nr:putative calcium-transporting ATPase [Tetrabaena socialis]|eukprot:PNH08520.1 putative calcium-transporting ATPase [Tetrabaena socialis]
MPSHEGTTGTGLGTKSAGLGTKSASLPKSTGLAVASRHATLNKQSVISLVKKSLALTSTQVDSESELPDGAPWWSLSGDGVVQELCSSTSSGLTSEDAARRLKEFGPNKLSEVEKPGFFKKLWHHLNNIIIWLLLAAAVVKLITSLTSLPTGALQSWAEFGLILVVVAVNTAIGMVQEGRAEKAADAIKAMLSPNALVLRDGQQAIIPAADLVPGAGRSGVTGEITSGEQGGANRAELPAGVDPGSLSAGGLVRSQPFLAMVMLLAILDPPREEAVAAIKVAHAAGITVKMITAAAAAAGATVPTAAVAAVAASRPGASAGVCGGGKSAPRSVGGAENGGGGGGGIGAHNPRPAAAPGGCCWLLPLGAWPLGGSGAEDGDMGWSRSGWICSGCSVSGGGGAAAAAAPPAPGALDPHAPAHEGCCSGGCCSGGGGGASDGWGGGATGGGMKSGRCSAGGAAEPAARSAGLKPSPCCSCRKAWCIVCSAAAAAAAAAALLAAPPAAVMLANWQ